MYRTFVLAYVYSIKATTIDVRVPRFAAGISETLPARLGNLKQWDGIGEYELYPGGNSFKLFSRRQASLRRNLLFEPE